MALKPVPIAVTGASHDAQQFRMMVKDLARDQQGVTTGLDLKVTALAVNGAGVQVGDGSAVIAGVASPVQGHYSAYNIGTDTVSISATGGTSRSDMVILRVEDPEYEGTRDPQVDPIVFFEVISNVGSSATTVPSGYSAIPLARIDIPASTATITDAMITDLRKVANPRRERQLLPFFYTGAWDLMSGNDEVWRDYPATATFSIAVPEWASRVRIKWDIAGVRLDDGSIFAEVTFQFGTKQAAQSVYIDDNQGTVPRRYTVIMADNLSLTDTLGAPMRGTTVTLKSRMRPLSANVGTINITPATTFVADVEFEEGAL